MTEHVVVTDEDATRVITLRRPEKKNALTQEMYAAMSNAIDTAQNNPAIRCLIITGGSGVFTAGNDLDDFLKASGSAQGRSTADERGEVPQVAGLQRQADDRSGGRHCRRHRHHDDVPLRLRSRQHHGDVLDAVHPSWSGAGRRFEPAGADDDGPSARVLDAGDGPPRQRAGCARKQVSSTRWSRRAIPKIEARKVAREICALPAEAVALSRKLLKQPPRRTRPSDRAGKPSFQRAHELERRRWRHSRLSSRARKRDI